MGPVANEVFMGLKQAVDDVPFMRFWPGKGPGAPARDERTQGLRIGAREEEQLRVLALAKPSRVPISEIERSTVAILRENGESDLGSLLREVARQVYRKEIRRGSAADLGVWGPELFLRDVAREIWAGDGALWTIR